MSDVLACLFVWAQANPAGGEPAEGASPMVLLFYIVPFFALYYFLFIRPQRRQDKLRQDMLNAMKRNDRVLTSGGIYGTVMSIDPEHDRVVVRVDDDKGVRLTFSRASIVRVMGEPEKAVEPSAGSSSTPKS